ncbi:ISAzo13 family transposase [Rhodococcus sp. IEGM 1351]|uniref:ISAzo13 family transposase n=1 Tax=Rhodococcus sp. IEGM 1351 TaxID=3047089 RepID=UPI0024B6BC53|nr:ISAzo13 family transposase [Rhodococcus sp. IEGM 1351]MDI9941625.1 ISAzo13 family transposase [Rhodococcus sp. IEGM 1351]
MSEVEDRLRERFEVLLPHLNERQRRLALAAEARSLGHGGVRAVARAVGVSETTVRRGVFELEAGEHPAPTGRIRRPGGGRKGADALNPQLVPALLALVEPDERGDPESPLRWTTKSLRHLAEELTRKGHPVSAPTVGRLLRDNGFSLQANAKTLEGEQHPDRDVQFRYINEQVKAHQDAGEPVISVDSKKKEQLGQLPTPGREWRPQGDPVRVVDHSFFTGPNAERAIPYGIYDLTTDAGWVNVGVDHDTAAFAVASIRRWWQARGAADYPHASRLLITADAGGSNSYRYRLWKAELAALATETGLAITVCHFPPGTSKWNKIEHRLFSQITMNWRGRPLTSHEVVVKTIASTRTRTGLRVDAELDVGDYPIGISVGRDELRTLPIRPHAQCGTWNYTIEPTHADAAPVPGRDREGERAAAVAMLADPRLTGMTGDELDELTARLAPAQAARAEQRRWHQRGGRRRNAPGAGGRRLLSDAAALLITVVYLRQVCPQRVLSDLLGVNPNSIGEIIAETRMLLDEHGHHVTPTIGLRFSTAADLAGFLRDGTAPVPTPNRPLPEALSHPALTGMSRRQLGDLVERLAVRQAAMVERRRYAQRGGERMPGGRGGIFLQKITDAERVLATVLHMRQLCNRAVLAELFQVSPRTIGNALLDVRPLLEQDGYTPAPATIRYRTAAALLAAIPPREGDTPESTH